MAANTAPDDVDLTASDDEVAIDLDAPAAADGVTVDGSTVTITAAGTYRLSGTLADGSVVVNTTDDGVVHLILDDASIGSSTTSPLQVLDADQVVVHLEGENDLSDTTAYADTDEASAALFSSADLTITGDGSLTVDGNANDGIAAKDGLVIAGGTITVDAVDDGIRGKDYLVVTGGTLDVTAGGDGLKSDNDEDETLGYVEITGGSVDVTAGDDGIAAQTDAIVADGTVSVVAGGGHDATVADDASPKGVSGTVSVVVGGGRAARRRGRRRHRLRRRRQHRGRCPDPRRRRRRRARRPGAADQRRDGRHHDLRTRASRPGSSRSPAATSASWLSDDGVNASDPDATGRAGARRLRRRPTSGSPSRGGTIVVDSGGDGLDANGFLTMTGGTAVVSGPTNDGNGALDVDGTFDVSGGTLLAAGASGMAMTPGADSAQSFVAFTFDSTQSGRHRRARPRRRRHRARRVRVDEGLLVAGLRVGGRRRGPDVLGRDGRLGHRRHDRRPRGGRRQHRHDGRGDGHGRRGDRRDGRRHGRRPRRRRRPGPSPLTTNPTWAVSTLTAPSASPDRTPTAMSARPDHRCGAQARRGRASTCAGRGRGDHRHMADERDDAHRPPPGTSEAVVDAVGALTAAFEVVEHARGMLYAFHRLTGRADNELAEALDQLAEAGHQELADELRAELVGRNVLPGRWTFQVVEEYDDRVLPGVRGGREARPRRAHGRPSARVRGPAQGGEPHPRPPGPRADPEAEAAQQPAHTWSGPVSGP